ncbi:MAG TPA: hypothetical protein VFY83_01795 [Anaerolineales bacterium]|nr:hypothetical protein [Anaerolineales bacterium]
MKYRIFPIIFAFVLILSSCQDKPACPQHTKTERPGYLSVEEMQALPTPTYSPFTPVEMKINGKLVTVDKIIEGPLCNDTWQGTVYVSCNVQILEWNEKPLFLKDCNLSIADGTTVYVASHNYAPYFNGCSCHTGQDTDLE